MGNIEIKVRIGHEKTHDAAELGYITGGAVIKIKEAKKICLEEVTRSQYCHKKSASLCLFPFCSHLPVYFPLDISSSFCSAPPFFVIFHLLSTFLFHVFSHDEVEC